MVPPPVPWSGSSASAPRTRGDGPPPNRAIQSDQDCSPHPRKFPSRLLRSRTPARAGTAPRPGTNTSSRSGAPRQRLDDREVPGPQPPQGYVLTIRAATSAAARLSARLCCWGRTARLPERIVFSCGCHRDAAGFEVHHAHRAGDLEVGALQPAQSAQRVDQGRGSGVGAAVDRGVKQLGAVSGHSGDGHAEVIRGRVAVAGALSCFEDP